MSPAIKLTIRFDKSVLASSRGLPSPDSRHRKEHYNSIVRANETFPLPWDSCYQSKTDILEGHVAKYSGIGSTLKRRCQWKCIKEFENKTKKIKLSLTSIFCNSDSIPSTNWTRSKTKAISNIKTKCFHPRKLRLTGSLTHKQSLEAISSIAPEVRLESKTSNLKDFNVDDDADRNLLSRDSSESSVIEKDSSLEISDAGIEKVLGNLPPLMLGFDSPKDKARYFDGGG